MQKEQQGHCQIKWTSEPKWSIVNDGLRLAECFYLTVLRFSLIVLRSANPGLVRTGATSQ